jgi:hypothetical protein
MLYIFIGNIREGKTISIITEGKKFFDDGYTIFSNTPVKYRYTLLKRSDIINWEKEQIPIPSKCCFLIDEIHAWFDSRNSQSSNNKVFSYFMTQLGKFTDNKQKGLTILGTTQFFSQMDIRGRRIVDKVITCKKLEEKKDEYIIVYRKWQKNNNLVLHTTKKEIIKFSKEDFDLFDTQQEIKSQEEQKENYVLPKKIKIK